MEANDASAAAESDFEFELIFRDGSARNTARIPNAKWDEHKQLLCSLYREKTVNEILAFMKTSHGFVVNAGQLGRKLREWGVYKYDTKKRPPGSEPSSVKCTDIRVPAILSDENTQSPLLENFPAADMAVQVPPVAHDLNASSTITKPLKEDEALSTRGSGWDFDCLVTSVIQAYQDAAFLVDLTPKEVPHNVAIGLCRESLGHSLSYGQRTIELRYSLYEADSKVAYPSGDSKAREKMTDILRMFHVNVLLVLRRCLTQAQSFELTFWRLASETLRARAIKCLDRLYDRLSIAANAENKPTNGNQEPRSRSRGDASQSISANDYRAQAEKALPTVSISAVPITDEDSGNVHLSDIDMDRLSAISVTSSARSMKSLARRIKAQQTVRRHLDRASTGDLPSSVMQWDRSSDRGLRLFGQLSSKSSNRSSVMTDASDMSWRREIPATIQDDGFAGDEAMLTETDQDWPRPLSPKAIQRLGYPLREAYIME